MRYFAYLLLVLTCLTSAFAGEVKIRTLILDGKPAYVLYTGSFLTQEAALAQKQHLPTPLHLEVNIEQDADTHRYTLKLGPTRNYEEAKTLQRELSALKLEENAPTPTEATDPPPITTSSPSPDSPESTQPQPLPDPSTRLWNLNNADIRAVITEVSRVTRKNFIIDPRVQGKISIVSNTPLSDKALYQVFLSMLQLSGYAAIPSGKVIKIVPNLEAKTLAPDILTQATHPPHGEEMMISVIPVHYVPSEQLVPVLRPLMPQWSYVSAYAPSNMLILSGRADNIKQISQIIKQIDSSSTNDIDVISLHHALAMDIAATLKDLMKSSSGNNTHSQNTTLAVDDRNNAILLSGSKTERLRLHIIISKLDRQTSNSASNNTQVIYLNYLRAEDLVPILAGVAQANFSGTVGTTIGTITKPELDSTNPASSLSTDNGPYSTMPPPKPSTTPEAAANTTSANNQNEGSTKPHVQIIAEPNTNSIIINAPASVIRILKTVISQLDIRPAQILIEALVAEINESDVKNLGIEWGSIGQTKNAGNFRPGFAIINSRTSVNDFQAQIYALQQNQRANVLSTPSVVVLDNRQAKILVGRQVSVAATSYPNNANGTAPSSSPFVTFNRVNVALHLYVRPQITRERGIQLQIDEGNNTIEPSSLDNTTNPIFKISSIVTAIHIQSGDTVVLGGLAEDSLANNDTSIPILRDIPGIGRIFQRNLRNREKRILMVFIRPVILRTPGDAIHVTGSKYHDTREEELRILRTQEAFVQSDDQTVMPALHQAHLPTPFSPATTTK